MKKNLILLFAITASCFSCSKDYNLAGDITADTNEPVAVVKEPYRIKTLVDNIESKTSYAEETTFSWVKGDIVSVQLKKDASYNKWRFTADESTSTSNLTSTKNTSNQNHADLGWSIGQYAFYPNALAPTNAEIPAITLPGSINQNMSNPLSNVPLIGINQGDETFKFKSGTGVLKLTFRNVFATINRLELVSNKKASGFMLSGNSTFDPSTYKIEGGSSNVIYVIPSSVSNGGDIVFYVPVPEGTIPENDLKIALYANGGFGYFLDNVYNPGPIEIERGIITNTPVIPLNPLKILPGRYQLGSSNAYITLAEESTNPSYNIKITRYDNTDLSLDLSGECLGNFDVSTGTLTFPYCQTFANTGEIWDGSSYTGSEIWYSFRGNNYPTAPLTLTFGKDGLTGDLRLSKYVKDYNSTSGYLNYAVTDALGVTLTKK